VGVVVVKVYEVVVVRRGYIRGYISIRMGSMGSMVYWLASRGVGATLPLPRKKTPLRRRCPSAPRQSLLLSSPSFWLLLAVLLAVLLAPFGILVQDEKGENLLRAAVKM